jgi:perosamine synthetase
MNIPYGRQYIDQDDIDAVIASLKSGTLTQGSYINDFEVKFANKVGAKYSVLVSSGTAALHLAGLSVGLGIGKTLITSPISFVATANMARYVGASVSFVDICPDTINMCPSRLNDAVESLVNPYCIVPVHFAGLPCEMSEIKRISDERGLRVIEDAAHALGACYSDGGFVGNCKYSDATIFSLHPVKSMTTGEGGVITTNSKSIYDRLRNLRSHGITRDPHAFKNLVSACNGEVVNSWYYEMQELGFNYRMTDMQAALGASQLKKLDLFIERRKHISKKYDEAFSTFKNLKPAQIDFLNISARHLYVVRINFESLKISRETLMKKLRDLGIGTQVHYIPISMHPAYENFANIVGDITQANLYYEQALSLPIYYELTEQDQLVVIDALMELVG